MAIPSTGQLWPKCVIKSKFSTIFLLFPVPLCPSGDGRSSWACYWVWNLRSAPSKKLGQISFELITLSFSWLTSYTKSLDKEKPKLSWNDWWNLSKVSWRVGGSELILLQKKGSQGGVVFWANNCICQYPRGSFSLTFLTSLYFFVFDCRLLISAY